MKRTILAAAAAALLASATFGIAAPDWRGGERPQPSPEQFAENAGAMTDARIAALKAGLRLSPDQEKLWPALETALRTDADQRIEARQERLQQRDERRQAQRGPDARGPDARAPEGGPGGPEGDVVARLQQRADRMLERGSALKSLADAAAPLYASLDEAQKHRFAILFRQAEGPRMAFRDGPHGKRWEDRGPHRFGPPGPGMDPPPAPAPDGDEQL